MYVPITHQYTSLHRLPSLSCPPCFLYHPYITHSTIRRIFSFTIHFEKCTFVCIASRACAYIIYMVIGSKHDSVVIGFALSCFLLSLSPWSQFPLHLIYWLWVHCQQHNTIITSDSTHIMLSGLPRSSMYAVCTLLSHWDWKRLNVNGWRVGWVFKNSAVENVLCDSLQRTTQTANKHSQGK